jgi:hypothetical protein
VSIAQVPDPSQSSIWHIPFRRNPFFTGHEQVLSNLRTMLLASQSATLVQPPAISGLGGIGKTQTAIEYAYLYQEDYRALLWVQANSRETLISDITHSSKPHAWPSHRVKMS